MCVVASVASTWHVLKVRTPMRYPILIAAVMASVTAAAAAQTPTISVLDSLRECWDVDGIIRRLVAANPNVNITPEMLYQALPDEPVLPTCGKSKSASP